MREVRSLEGELDGRLQPAHRGSSVVPRSLELVGVDRLLFHERLDRVRQLDLATGASLRLLELVEDLRRQDVAADDRQVRRCVGGRGLLDDARHAPQAITVEVRVVRLAVDDAVARDLLVRDTHDRDDRRVRPLVRVDQLADRRSVSDDDVIGQQHRERLVADEVLGHQDRVSQPELLLLANVRELSEVADRPDLAELLDLALLLEDVLELGVQIEVVLDRPLVRRGDDDDLLDAGGNRFLDAVLDDRLVDQWQHFLGLGLGRREEARAPAGSRENSLSDAQSNLVAGIGKGGIEPAGRIAPAPFRAAPPQSGSVAMKSSTRAVNASGLSTFDRWPALGMSRAFAVGTPARKRVAPIRKTRSVVPLITR